MDDHQIYNKYKAKLWYLDGCNFNTHLQPEGILFFFFRENLIILPPKPKLNG